MARFEIETVAYPLVYEEEAAFKDTYGGVEGVVVCESYLIRPKDLASDTVLVFMHPVGGGAYLPMVRQLAKEGHHVIRSEEHTSELQSLMRISYAVFCLKKKTKQYKDTE